MKISSDIQKLSRAAAYELIRERLEQPGARVLLTREEAEALFMHFAPKAPAMPKTGWDWIRRAPNPKDDRPQCRYVYSDGSSAYATNGHVLLKTTASMACVGRPGFYCPKTGALVDLDREPLPYDQAIREPEADEPRDWTKWERIADGKLIKRKTPDGVLFNEALLEKAAPGGKYIAERVPPDHHSALQGRSDFGLFVVMPMRW